MGGIGDVGPPGPGGDPGPRGDFGTPGIPVSGTACCFWIAFFSPPLYL